ncbi:class I lanthipeptide [Flavobacteriaceae bacterium M23B6Z8]
MKKLDLNKRTISQLDKVEMNEINGGGSVSVGFCIASCERGSRKGKDCCDSGGIDGFVSISLPIQ